MTDKDTQKFSRESFKERILKQLEESEAQLPTTRLERTQAASNDREVDEAPSTIRQPISERQDDQQGTREASAALDVDEERPRASRSTRSHGTSRRDGRSHNTPRQTAGKIIAIVAILLVLILVALGFFGYSYFKSGVQPLDKKDTTTKSIQIPEGTSTGEIGQILERNHIIKNGTLFKYYSKIKSFTDFKSGYYNLSPSMTLTQIATELEKGGTAQPQSPSLGKITIPEGYTLVQIADAITKNAANKDEATPFSKEAFLAAVQNDELIGQLTTSYPELFASLPSKDSGVKYQLEGYLFPATYDYDKSTTVESLITSMVDAMNTQLTPYYAAISAKQLSVNEVLSLASYVEKEGNTDDDRKNIAQVFYNRIASGMPLQSNISILYAEDKVGQKTSLAEDAGIDTTIDSPYNLYQNTGYGPGPVDNPSLAAIKATIEPIDNDDLYFVADVTTGKVYFSKTLAEHEQNVAQYVNDKLS